MKESKIVILGSCVSRDIFNIDKELTVDEYFPRTTLASLFGERYNIRLEDIISEHPYRSKCIFRDLTNAFLDYDFTNSYIILDFIDERLDLLKKDGKIIGTASWEYSISNLPKKLIGIEKCKNSFEEWKKGCNHLIDFCIEKGILNRIILHKCFYKKEYWGKDKKNMYL